MQALSMDGALEHVLKYQHTFAKNLKPRSWSVTITSRRVTLKHIATKLRLNKMTAEKIVISKKRNY
jgi:hypothetical protein